MFMQPTMEKLYALKLIGMADALNRQMADPGTSQLSFEERFSLLVDQQWTWKQNKALARRLRNAKLRSEACLEDFDWREPRGLDRAQVRSLATSDWVRQHHNLLISGPTGVGKSFLASAFAQKACRDGFTALQLRIPQLFRDLAVAHADGSFGRLLRHLAHIDVLIIDDFAMAPMSEAERRDLLEICDDRYGLCSTILTSQLPVANWHAQVGDPTVADSILDRLVHNAYSLVLKGGSMRKTRAAGGGK